MIVIFLLLFCFFSTASPALALTVKDTLSTSQLSYFARLGVGNSEGSTILNIATSANPSINTNNLFVDDVIGIGRSNSNGLDLYTVKDISNATSLIIDPSLALTNATADNIVIATRSAIHTISFTPETSATDGIWQFLIKATSTSGENPSDGIPDQNGFDIGADVGSTTTGTGTRIKAADVSCPFGSASVGTTVIISSETFHAINCTLSGGATNPTGVGVTITIGRDLSTGSQIINPSSGINHTEGQADGSSDTHAFYLRHLESTGSVITSVKGTVAVVEAIRVTAVIDPTLSFTIDSVDVGVGDTRCGNVLGGNAANTTATSVSYGSLSLGTFSNLSQRLTCNTNASTGYIVTVYEEYPMTIIGGAGDTIPDTDCDAGDCTPASATAWVSDTTESGWGYSLENVNVGITAFNYNIGSSFTAKPFGVGSSNSQTIMSNTSRPTSPEQAFICYRIIPSTSQKAGNYETKLVYIATAVF